MKPLPTRSKRAIGGIRPQRVADCQRLRAEGLTLREIGVRLGLATQTVHAYLQDPDGSLVRERKAGYGGTCGDCGAATSYRTGGASDRCPDCAHRAQIVWTEANVVEAMRGFHRRYGRAPVARDWNPQQARAQGREDLANRFYADACWPTVKSVQRVFGSWRAAIVAAGFPVLGPDRKPVAA